MPKKMKGGMHYGATNRNVGHMMGRGVTRGMSSMPQPKNMANSQRGAKAGKVMKMGRMKY